MGGSGGLCGAEARLVVLDAEDNAFATEAFPLGEQFERFSVAIENFTESIDGATGIDLEAIAHIGLELLATCTEPPPAEYGADDLAIAVPEPRSLGATALAGLEFVYWSRRCRAPSSRPRRVGGRAGSKVASTCI